jgi:class 3 adenylate cyclase/tetratricopeptide (TPR) repeat protein
MPVCSACSQRNPDVARFCLACGVPLVANGLRGADTRKTVTVLFCDVSGSTRLGERLDPESLREVMESYFELIEGVVERHGGVVEKFIGDAVMAVFGVPLVHEDDAVRAVRAAWEARAGLARLDARLERERGVQLAVRMGLNTGEVVAFDDAQGQRLVTGDAVNVAARMEQAATPGEIRMGDATYQLVRDAVVARDAGTTSVRGRAELVRAWHLDGVEAGAAGLRRLLETPLIGRNDERAMLRQAFDRARHERRCHLVTVLGEPGVGKSRLVEALRADVSASTDVHIGQCLPYGDGITYWPLGEVVRSAAGIRSDDSPARAEARILELAPANDRRRVAGIVAAAIGLSQVAVGEPGEVAWATRRLFEMLSVERPTVLVFEDVHWAEAAMLGVISHLCERAREASILVVCTARPEARDVVGRWSAGAVNATTFLLPPLSENECDRMIDLLPAGRELDSHDRRRVVSASEGNPLFCEQMVAMLGLDSTNGADTKVPTTIRTLLAARLDRLASSQRRVLQAASVEGRVFHRSGLLDLMADLAGVDDILDALVSCELIAPHESQFAGDQAFRFGHALIRDAAYDALPKRDRARLHERVADWLEHESRERPGERAEILGYHLEQAQRCLSELGPLDDNGRAVARRGGEVLADAGRRAGARGDHAAAANLLGRARALLPARAARARDIDPLRALALIEGGDLVTAGAELERAVAEATAASDRRAAVRATLELLALRDATGTHSVSSEDVSNAAVAAIPILAAAGDEAGLARAWQLSGDVHWSAGRWGERAVALEQALTHAQRAADTHGAAVITCLLAGGLVFGATPVETGIARCTQFLENSPGPYADAAVTVALAALQAMAARFEEAHRLYAQACGLHEELGSRLVGASSCLQGARIARLAGDQIAAERELRVGYDAFRAMGEQAIGSTVAGELGRALYELQRFADADEMTAYAQHITAPDDVLSIVLWQSTRAKLLARSGDHQQAIRLAESALALMETTDELNEHAQTLLDLAEVLRLGDRTHEAAAAAERACGLYEAKGNIAGAAITRTLRAKLISAEH